MIVLLDSNIWFSGLTVAGNERQLIRRLLARDHTVAITDLIRDEVVGVLARKLSQEQSRSAVSMFRALLATSTIFVKERGRYEPHLGRAREYINEKDAPILAAGLQQEIDLIVSGDKAFVKNPKLDFLRRKKIVTTVECLGRL